MTGPINMPLYRLLLKGGASEADAEEAARIDASALATKADLAGLRTEMVFLRWMIGVAVTLVIAFGVGNIWLSLNVLSRIPR